MWRGWVTKLRISPIEQCAHIHNAHLPRGIVQHGADNHMSTANGGERLAETGIAREARLDANRAGVRRTREGPLLQRRGRSYHMATLPSSSEPSKPSESSEGQLSEDMSACADHNIMNEQPDTPTGRFFGQHGQSLFEYALIILFVALAVVVGLALIAPALNNIFHQVPNAF